MRHWNSCQLSAPLFFFFLTKPKPPLCCSQLFEAVPNTTNHQTSAKILSRGATMSRMRACRSTRSVFSEFENKVNHTEIKHTSPLHCLLRTANSTMTALGDSGAACLSFHCLLRVPVARILANKALSRWHRFRRGRQKEKAMLPFRLKCSPLKRLRFEVILPTSLSLVPT